MFHRCNALSISWQIDENSVAATLLFVLFNAAMPKVLFRFDLFRYTSFNEQGRNYGRRIYRVTLAVSDLGR